MPPLHDMFPVLFLHESTVDLYLRSVREAIAVLPRGVLSLEEGCSLVVTDVVGIDTGSKVTGVVLGYGFHHSDFGFGPEKPPIPTQGIVLKLHPPASHDGTYCITDVVVPVTTHTDRMLLDNHLHFKVGDWEYRLTPQEFDLDKVVCCVLETGAPYEKPPEPDFSGRFED
jgi:hypothetical protein